MTLLLPIAFFVFFLVHQFWWRRRGLPNGPLPLPIIGNLYQFMFARRWEEKFVEFKERYGPIYTLFLGPISLITVNDYDTCVKLFVGEPEAYSDRPAMEHFDLMTRGGNLGILQLSGQKSIEQRRAALRILKDFGLGKNEILDEIQTVCDSLNKEINAGVIDHNVNQYTDIGVGSVINSLLCGYRFTTNAKESEFYHLKAYSNQFVQFFNHPLTQIGMNSATFAKFPFVRAKILQFKGLFGQLFSFVDKSIEEHNKMIDYEQEEFAPHDFIDAYMLEMWKARKSGNGHYYSEEQCRNVVLDLWLAGQETSSTTIQWALAYLALNPDKQAKLHAELDRVIGGDRLILMSDRPKLNYLNAVITEVQRCANLAVFNAPHALGKDVILNGLHLKKGTVVVPQVSTIMQDSKNFPEPHTFCPERFINPDGQLFNTEKVLPFGLGRRACLGEGLARMELFLFIGNLLNQYKFLPGTPAPNLERFISGGPAICKPYNCRLEKRH